LNSSRTRGADMSADSPRRGTVVLYSPDARSFSHTHERITRAEIATRLAVLKGLDFANDYDPSIRYADPVYFVPSDTLVGVQAAHELGIRSEHDLFGGVVPHPFVATKAITHPLIESDAYAPVGWSHEFGRRVHDAVLFGVTAFTPDDARRAGLRLMAHGPVRIKPVRATGGRGQSAVFSPAELDAALALVNSAELSDYGLVLEENLGDVTTRSVGQLRVDELVATYHGRQRLTTDNSGGTVYGGSEIVIVRGDFEALLRLDLSEEARIAVAQSRAYDAAATECFPGMFASRRNYDVAQGFDAERHWRSGVLEQSWRIGGVSSAEIAALEAFRTEPRLQAVRASCVEIYGESDPPPQQAIVYFRGTDERVGPLTKYTLVEAYDDAR
jgi:hypothetical protein